MSIVMVGSTSGSITLQEPAVAGSNTINLPAATGTAILADSSNNLQMNSGYGSNATAYGCRAWVNFNGTSTPAIRASGNVSSITDNGVGDYTVNFTNAMPNVNYAVNGITGADAFDDNVTYTLKVKVPGTNQLVGSVRIHTIFANVGVSQGFADFSHVFISVFR